MVDGRDRGLSIRAIAESEGITPATVRYYVRKARRLGKLVRIDGRGRHKRPIDRRPISHMRALEDARWGGGGGAQPVAEPLIPRSRDADGRTESPGPEWRHIENAWFVWTAKLAKPELMIWAPESAGMQNGTRWRRFRHNFLGQVFGTVIVYSGTFRVVLQLDKIAVRWADMARWNDMLWALAFDAQARLGRDLADLGTSVTQSPPEPREDPSAAAARKAGEPVLVTGNLYLPVDEPGKQGKVNDYVWKDDSPPGPGVETPGVRWAHVADHLPDRVIALEEANGRIMAALERIEQAQAALVREAEESRKAQERIAQALERAYPKKEPEQAPGKAAENPDNWRMFA